MAVTNKREYVMKELDGYTKTTTPIRYNRHYTRYGARYTLYPIETVHNNTHIHWARVWLKKNIHIGATARLVWEPEEVKEEYYKLYPPKDNEKGKVNTR